MVISNLNVGVGNYNLPAATASSLGGIKVGSTMSISDSGVLNAVTASKLIMTDPANSKTYSLQFKMSNDGKPTIEWEELLS
jgi:hypothetical protein